VTRASFARRRAPSFGQSGGTFVMKLSRRLRVRETRVDAPGSRARRSRVEPARVADALACLTAAEARGHPTARAYEKLGVCRRDDLAGALELDDA